MLGLGNSINSSDFDHSAGGPPAAKMLDTFSGATAAYSLRLLSNSYSGNCVTVRRDSDNLDANIGFSGGALDTSALAAHCGSANGFVATWFDQSGNSRNAAQLTDSRQPKIYDGTTGVMTENGKPALQFDGTDDFLDLSLGALNINNMSVHTVSRPLPSGTTNDAGHTLAASDAVYWLHFIQRIGSVHKDRFFYGSTLDSGVDVDNNQHVYSFIAGSTAGYAAMYRDGTKISADITLASKTINADQIGAFIDSLPFEGTKQEFVVYGSDTTNSRTNIESDINTFYSIF